MTDTITTREEWVAWAEASRAASIHFARIARQCDQVERAEAWEADAESWARTIAEEAANG